MNGFMMAEVVGTALFNTDAKYAVRAGLPVDDNNLVVGDGVFIINESRDTAVLEEGDR